MRIGRRSEGGNRRNTRRSSPYGLSALSDGDEGEYLHTEFPYGIRILADRLFMASTSRDGERDFTIQLTNRGTDSYDLISGFNTVNGTVDEREFVGRSRTTRSRSATGIFATLA